MFFFNLPEFKDLLHRAVSLCNDKLMGLAYHVLTLDAQQCGKYPYCEI